MKLLADAMLAKLGRRLRILGHDTDIMDSVVSDTQVLNTAKREHRLLITRDKQLHERARKDKLSSILIAPKTLQPQLNQAFSDLKIQNTFPENARCSNCNVKLKETERPELGIPIPSKRYWQCPKCKQYYWQGTHYEKIEKAFKEAEAKGK
ncbi:MAG: DUF5615 family PIN-like protein [DPANN group archaeon]|nr:DUF5615 family PIN-like protein [DPANN group archaeon]